MGDDLLKHILKELLFVVATCSAAYVFWFLVRDDTEQIMRDARKPNDFVLENFPHMMGPSLDAVIVGTGDKLERATE